MQEKIKNLIILGPQGSGKGTQAKLLADKFGYVFFGAGDILREIAKENSELGRRIHKIINVEGKMVEPELIAEVYEQKLKKLDIDQPVIMEGFPRNIEQYKLMKKFWPTLRRGDYQVLFIELSEEEAVGRLSTRFICERCNEIYVGNAQGKCKKCAARLIQREDDKPAAVRVRFQLFKERTMPMVEKLEKEGRVIRIDGKPAIPEVHKEILKKFNLS